MRPIRNPEKPPLRRRAPSARWARPGPAWSCPEPAGAAGPDAHARPRSARCLGRNTQAHLGRQHARTLLPLAPR